jgi:DNA-binding transcriptional LysR family regulator
VLDLLKLQSFRMVANTRSFTRAAVELGYSQSSVTAHVQALEREVGAPLFERSRFSREINLTDAGRRTLEYASRLLSLAEETRLAIRSQSEPGGQLKICTSPLLLAYRLSPLLRRYRLENSNVRLDISAYSDARVLTGTVVNGVADIAFLFDEPGTSDRVVSSTLGRERLYIVCSPEHPLSAHTRGVDLDHLAHNQVLYSDANCSIRLLFERTLAQAHLQVDNVLEAGSIEAVKRCAANGFGFAVLPGFAVQPEIEVGELVTVPLPHVDLALDVQIVRNSRHWVSPAARAMWDLGEADAGTNHFPVSRLIHTPKSDTFAKDAHWLANP